VARESWSNIRWEAELAPRILIIDDDRNLVEGLTYNLVRAGYVADAAADGPAGLDRAAATPPDLVLLDLMLPGPGGMEVLTSLRAAGIECPVIILSAIADETEKVRGFDLGAVDYVTKPFGLAELLARIRVRLSPGAREGATLTLAGGTVHLDQFRFETGDEAIPLTPTEVDILKTLAARRGEVVSREDLTREIWGLGARSTRTLDTHVARLRKKVEADPARPRNLVTVHGVGYRLVP
jgi:DNA-binding response OmpR family regulator